MSEGANAQQVVGIKRDILTGTQQVIVDRDMLLSAIDGNKEIASLLRDIRKLISFSVPRVQVLAIPTSRTVDNVSPVEIFFRGANDNEIATMLAISGNVDFFYDFDRPASTNSPEYNLPAAQLGSTVWIPNIQVSRLSILAASAGPYTINAQLNGLAPTTNYITIRAWRNPYYIDESRI